MFRNIIVLAIAASALSTTDAVNIERSREVERDLRFKLGGMGKGNKVIDPCVASCQVDFDVCVDTCAPSDCIPLDATASPTKGKGMSMSMGMNKFGMSKGKGKGSSEAPVRFFVVVVVHVVALIRFVQPSFVSFFFQRFSAVVFL